VIIVTEVDVIFLVLQKKFVAMGFKPIRYHSHEQVKKHFSTTTQSKTVVMVIYDDRLFGSNCETLEDVNIYAPLVVIGDCHPSWPLAEQVREMGCKFLAKPVKDASWIEALREALSGRSVKRLNLSSLRSSGEGPGSNRSGRKYDNVPFDQIPLRILVAEDNPTNQKVLMMMLRRMGCTEVSIACNGEDVIASVLKELPDLIFMDVCMPGTDGVDCTKIIRKLPNGQQPFITALTADVFPEDQRKCLAAGMDLFLTKPLKVDVIRTAIRKAREKVQALQLDIVVD